MLRPTCSDSHAIAYLDHVPQHTQFFQKYAGNAGVKTAEVFTSRLYQSGKRGELGNRELYNRHALLHSVSSDALRQTWGQTGRSLVLCPKCLPGLQGKPGNVPSVPG